MIEPPRQEDFRRPARNSRFLIVIIVGMATVVALQYTPRAFFGPDQTATLWGMLVGLFIGGFLFGWLKKPW
ncbi:MAG TPA: hypothetical protein VJ840_08250 [Gemmatimonadaceae bacterium]|nr:hypothetical protein [Gemmatimonadaceae bacterium]